MSPRVVVIAGVASGVGKTTVTLGLLEACRRRGLRVQAFKVGPDFIDPGFHEQVTGRPSYTLDGWMCGRDHALATVARHAADADLALVEGVMGCFDGAAAAADDGSTAQMAKWLDAPVVLVLDAGAQARSAAAVVRGFEGFDPALRVAGVIANRVGGGGHARLLREAIASACRAELIGAVPADPSLALPERHLGLVTAAEGTLTAARLAALGDVVERAVDLDRLLALARPLAAAGAPFVRERAGAPPRARIGVARDAAFQFYYPENLDLLRRAGADLVPWSPLSETPPEVDGLYIGGGYPEVHARALAANAGARRAVAELASSGAPIYAECGGLMYLAESLEDMEGVAHPMVGVLPARVSMAPRGLTLGYREVRMVADTPIGGPGVVARGHEFHRSTLEEVPAAVPRAYRVAGPGCPEAAEGYVVGRVLMSYVHLHFGSSPDLARRFVDACAGVRS